MFRRHFRTQAGSVVAVLLLVGFVFTSALNSSAAQDGDSTEPSQAGAAATVPIMPPWRMELIPRHRPLTVTVGETDLLVEVANTPQERSLGLGYRDGLPPGTGMLFVPIGEPRIENFWMGPMRFCLDIVWIRDNQIVGAAQQTCPGVPGGPQSQIPRFESPGPVDYVLEVPAGFLQEHGYGLGTPVSFSVDPHSIPPVTPVANQ